jgi:hypothetical protein
MSLPRPGYRSAELALRIATENVVSGDDYNFHGACVLKRARRNFTSAIISASDICGPKAGMERPSAPVGGRMPLLITSTTLSGTGA